MTMLKVEELNYGYGNEEVLRGISLSLQEGEILGILGDNGAGKSTLLTILGTLRQEESGNLFYFNQPKEYYSLQKLRESIGYVPQEIALYTEESPYENLRIFAKLRGLKGKVLTECIENILEDLGLTKEMHKPVKTLSGGMKRRTNLGVALIDQPKLLILDEPTVGIDFISRKAILKVLKALSRKGNSIIYSTHALEEVQYLCDRALVIENGGITQEISMKVKEQGILQETSMEAIFRQWLEDEKEEGQ